MEIINLCGEKGHCPAVKIEKERVSMGEDSNVCVLKRDEWNSLIEKIKTGELKDI